MRIRAALSLAALVVLAACASPCDRVRDDMRQLNADTVRDPAMLTDGRYLKRFQDLTAEGIEHSCF
ncbi:hypothetical protein [Rhodospirillum centenum]|uniref:Lipoprotein n=1 Tax=Rhodospirillum centenum (strain ATCC 51521 / SW) TaxID=414684 RepID=B6ISG1_RHOCS|nr:hypothetical protein [Rhodospirillum centenum]ACI98397.1 hypothetical protein RC1_0973 [Rhodospirillum centenum SW]